MPATRAQPSFSSTTCLRHAPDIDIGPPAVHDVLKMADVDELVIWSDGGVEEQKIEAGDW